MTLWRLGVVAASKAGASVFAGYVHVGNANGPNTSTIDKFLFSNDSRTTLANGLPSVRRHTTAAASRLAGYIAGGADPVISTASKMPYSTETFANLGTGLPAVRRNMQGLSFLDVAYFTGGADESASPPVHFSNIVKLTFSTDAFAANPTTLSATGATGGSGNDAALGYIHLGATTSNVGVSTINKFVLSTETRSTLPTGLSGTIRWITTGSFASTSQTVIPGGFVNSPLAAFFTVDAFNFADDSRTTLPNMIANRSSGMGYTSKSAGYYMAGFGASPLQVLQSGEKYTYSSTTWSSITPGLSSLGQNAAAFPFTQVQNPS